MNSTFSYQVRLVCKDQINTWRLIWKNLTQTIESSKWVSLSTLKRGKIILPLICCSNTNITCNDCKKCLLVIISLKNCLNFNKKCLIHLVFEQLIYRKKISFPLLFWMGTSKGQDKIWVECYKLPVKVVLRYCVP